MVKIFKTGIGQDSHRFLSQRSSKPCVLGGVIFPDVPGLDGDSDADVVLHSICNAVTSLSGVPILGGVAHELCVKDGITDSKVYLKKALETLRGDILHVSLALEGKNPRFQDRIEIMRDSIADILGIGKSQVGITATSGDGLSDFGCGEGIQCFCVLSISEEI
jgi:2-C-methyl-D-erythritol 2,4-cyclodiphosphate synthase